MAKMTRQNSFCFLAILTLLLGCLSFTPVNCATLTPELVSQMTNSLVPTSTNYSAFTRPQFGGAPVAVNISLTVHSISHLDTKSGPAGSFRLQVTLRQHWPDHRLNTSLFERSYDPKSWLRSPRQRVYRLPLLKRTLARQQLWTPQTFIVNALSVHKNVEIRSEEDTGEMSIEIELSSKTVYTSKRLDLTASCQMDFANYPYDTHRCYLELNSYIYLKDDVYYQWDSKLHSDQSVRIFKVADFYLVADSARQTYFGFPEDHRSRPAVEFYMRRKPVRFHLYVHLPALLLVALTWIPMDHFGVEASTGFSKRITFLSLLLLAFLLVATGHWLSSPISARLTLGDQFLFASLLLLALAFVDAALQGGGSSSSSSKQSQNRQSTSTGLQKCWLLFRYYLLLPLAALLVYGGYTIYLCLMLSISRVSLWDFF